MERTSLVSRGDNRIKSGKSLFRQASKKVLGARGVALGLVLFASLWAGSTVSAQSDSAFVRRARVIDTERLGAPHPAGVAFSRRADGFLVLAHVDPPGSLDSDLLLITHRERWAGSRRIAATISDPINMAFDNKAHRLLLYDAEARRLIEVRAGRDGVPDPDTLSRTAARRYGIEDAQGMAADPVTGRLFLLDGAGPRVVVVDPEAEGGLEEASVSTLDLSAFGAGSLRGIAFDPTSGHLHVFGSADQRLYEITDRVSPDVISRS